MKERKKEGKLSKKKRANGRKERCGECEKITKQTAATDQLLSIVKATYTSNMADRPIS